jgi:hypothetical protein
LLDEVVGTGQCFAAAFEVIVDHYITSCPKTRFFGKRSFLSMSKKALTVDRLSYDVTAFARIELLVQAHRSGTPRVLLCRRLIGQQAFSGLDFSPPELYLLGLKLSWSGWK